MTTNGHVRHLVIGAGFAGLGTAIKLDEDGETDFLVIEKGHDVGGTWRDNTYPGAACDVPSQLYSFSFAPNPDWSSSFSPQPEIHAYLRKVAARSGVLDRFRFGTRVEHAAWDEEQQHWRVRLSEGGEVTATTLISGAGGLSEPRLPDIDGIDSFQGEVFHSARWNHDVDLRGKRVAVIGTGASSIQIVPEVAKVAASLDVYQRTAPYVIPRGDRPYTRLERLAFRHLPLVQKAYRTGIYWGRELLVPGFTVNPKLAAPAKRLALANIQRGISDPALREAVTPDFEIGCKRILISNDYYPALDADHVRPRHRRHRQDHRRRDRHRRRHRAPDRRPRRRHRLLHHRAADRRAHRRPRGPQPGRGLARDRDGGLQGHHRARLPELLLDRRAEHRAGTLEHGLHDRVAGRLHPRRRPHHGDARLRRRRAAPRRAGRVERRPAAPDEAHRLVHRRLLELVPRRARPQHHPVAAHHLHLPQAAVALRRRRVRRDRGPPRTSDLA